MNNQYPIGQFEAAAAYSNAERSTFIQVLRKTPAEYRAAVAGLNETQLATPYREGGWTLRQVVHHVPDSHLNAYVRMKLALTEDQPTIKPYNEEAWALLPDTALLPPEASLALLEALHARWVVLLEALKESDWQRGFVHPATREADLAAGKTNNPGLTTLERALAAYAWHSKHHLAQVMNLRTSKGW